MNTETINKFKTSKKNLDYIKQLQDSDEFNPTITQVVSRLLELGIEEHKKRSKKK